MQRLQDQLQLLTTVTALSAWCAADIRAIDFCKMALLKHFVTDRSASPLKHIIELVVIFTNEHLLPRKPH